MKLVFSFLTLAGIAATSPLMAAVERPRLIVAISIGVGMVPLIAPNFKQWMPHGIHPLIESGILLASITALALNLFFNGAREDEAAVIAAAQQAEAH